MYDGEDRVRQVNEIDRVAQDLTSSQITVADYGGSVETFTYDVVADWLEAVDLPSWWDAHDTELLKDRVRQHAS